VPADFWGLGFAILGYLAGQWLTQTRGIS
jgi:hypothetical protein